MGKITNPDVTHKERRELNIKAETLSHYNPVEGVHVIIKRQERDTPNPNPREVNIYFGSFDEESIIEREGADYNGLRHFLEHIAVKGLTANRSAQRLMDEWPNLHLKGIHLNAATSPQSMRFDLSAPADVSFDIHLEFLQRLLSNDIFKSDDHIQRAIELDRGRILNEILKVYAENEIGQFVNKHVYTADSFANIPHSLGTPEIITHADAKQILALLKELYGDKPVVVTITNPPDDVSDEAIIGALPLTVRSPLKPEIERQSNHYNHSNTWLHMEHYRAPRNGEMNTHVAIPIEFDKNPRKTIAEFLILSSILDEGGRSPMAMRFQYGERLQLYSQRLTINGASRDIQFEADLEANQLGVYINEVVDFLNEPERQKEIEAGFTVFKKRLIDQKAGDFLDANRVASNLMFSGEYLTVSEKLAYLEGVRIEDVLALLEQLRAHSKEMQILTITGLTGRQDKQALLEQREQLSRFVNNQFAVIHDGQEEVSVNLLST